MSSRPLLVIASLGLLLPALATAGSLRCAGGMVSLGDPGAVVEARCGAPDLKEPLSETVLRGGTIVSEEERWSYNRGPNRLVRVVLLRNGRVSGFDSGGYGFRRFPGDRCKPRTIRRGLTRMELLGHCGPPDSSTTIPPRQIPGHIPGQRTQTLERPREEWIYSFGGNRFSRLVTLERGRVIRVETGPRLP